MEVRAGVARTAASDLRAGEPARRPLSPKRSPVPTVFEEYEKVAGKSIEDSIRSETHGSLEQAMLTVGESGWASDSRVSEGRGARRPSLLGPPHQGCASE